MAVLTSFFTAPLTSQNISALKPRERLCKPFCVQHDRNTPCGARPPTGAQAARQVHCCPSPFYFFRHKRPSPGQLTMLYYPLGGSKQAQWSRAWGRYSYPLHANKLHSNTQPARGDTAPDGLLYLKNLRFFQVLQPVQGDGCCMEDCPI